MLHVPGTQSGGSGKRTQTRRRARCPRAWRTREHKGQSLPPHANITQKCRSIIPEPLGETGSLPPPPPTRSPWKGQGNVSGPFTTGQVCRRNGSQTLHPKKLGEILDLREEKGARCANIPTVPSERGWGRTRIPTQGFSQVKAGLGALSWRRLATWPFTERWRDQG